MPNAASPLTQVRGVRQYLRSRFFRFLEHVSGIEDSRHIFSNQLMLHNLVQRDHDFEEQLTEPPAYPELPTSTVSRQSQITRGAIFISGRYRCGSSLLWNLFRHVPDVTAYYEPFNERRWFDRSARGAHVDPTHRGIADYWSEYDGLEQLAGFFDPEWKFRHLYMPANAWSPAMHRYLATMIKHAPGRPVLQFNEVDFRLAWLRHNFPGAQILHMYRHPRDQWCSTLGKQVGDMTHLSNATFAAADGYYLLRYGQDLRHYFPFLSVQAHCHPYELFYEIWKLSYLFGRRDADFSLSYEDLVATPEATIGGMMHALGIQQAQAADLARLVDATAVGRWKSAAPGDWFFEIEARVEQRIAEYLRLSGAAGPARAPHVLRAEASVG